jgi:hypothetical protein
MEKENTYLHDNLKMHTICGGKVQYPHYDFNPHYMVEGHLVFAWQFMDAHFM